MLKGAVMDDDLKQALRRLAKAVVVISSRHVGQRFAMVATAVSELSLDPPSMLVCVNRTASLFPPLHAGAPFVINILHHSQASVARRCTGPIKGEARFELGEWADTELGPPRLVGAQAAIVCRNARAHEYGTHGIFIGDVTEVFLHGEPGPLVYFDGRYGQALAHAEG